MSLREIPSLQHHFIKDFFEISLFMPRGHMMSTKVIEGTHRWLYHRRATAINSNLYYRDLTGRGGLNTPHWEYPREPTTKEKNFYQINDRWQSQEEKSDSKVLCERTSEMETEALIVN